ncbi:uncharacterized protein SCHCODRAFT_02631311 [Schizophyllum commune H4-8]|uniref:Uncharacterized protein n=1 Tax=Schizophyllum commune (strain H4-8 / FGSC 9210) TaxID=578458 RepID=D8Q9W0_SCHCM|nr:uncharacterized protein SCHCODRAFT_02631311 [Schizophyllum commune H4-8]KAI5890263.1 hypothetical protein SCHCODRAFT_02631311 [Schizophyllum commune H4-8]
MSRYRDALNALSARTGAPISSLVISFGLLHEVTAIVPLVGVFYAARSFGLGERVVQAVIRDTNPSTTSEDSPTLAYVHRTFRDWVEQGDAWAERVGRRYGVFGFEKRAPGAAASASTDASASPSTDGSRPRITGDVANAVLAYGVTKAAAPLRVALSLYLSPAVARGVVIPITRTFVNVFRRRK